MALAPSEFLADHVLDHGLRRFDGGEILSRAGRAVYPSRVGVWGEFASHMGWIWTAVSALAVAIGAGRAFRFVRAARGDAPAAAMRVGRMSIR